ncbi:hypothetical protein B0F90DRAFT_630755 [Multifurca ochricompacta]|uniref:Fungal STAND N-terminal Goodbye domain-containing protein n=1 Tax=Multifurca ochricompacta TaxID=376703 RepID=A0AAD4M299_9AGAM|nr:hypothetical protein B0F90DRAFT_630755 [Multifurca ochricompacta]
MSSPQLAETISSSDDLQSLLSTALTEYAQRTGTDLITHPLKAKLETLNSTSAVVDQLQHQARSINGFQNEDHKAELLARMKPIVDTLIVLSTSVALGDGTGLQLEFDPGKLAFIGIAILLDAAKDPNTDYEELIETCEFVGSVFGRLKLYAKVPFTVAATETVLKAMIEFIHILGFTKKLRDGRKISQKWRK